MKDGYQELVLSPRPNHVYEVANDFSICGINVPSGYRTNGADIPRIFWFFFPPNDSTMMPAVVVHDFLCSVAATKPEYIHADDKFNEVCLSIGVSKFRRLVYYFAISLYTKVFR